MDMLKEKAARRKWSLNYYVETVLLDDVYNEPNAVTKAAIEEAISGNNPNKIYNSVEELFKDLDAEE